MSQTNRDNHLGDDTGPHFSVDPEQEQDLPAWTEVEEGRFMPRRVRGSCRGRALG